MNSNERAELVNYRIKRAKETFSEIKVLADNKLWSTLVNRLYYACFYAVNALLIQKEIKVETHGGVRRMFGLHFVKTGLVSKESGKFYTDIFDIRSSTDYDDFIEIDEEKALRLISPAERLILEIEQLIGHVR